MPVATFFGLIGAAITVSATAHRDGDLIWHRTPAVEAMRARIDSGDPAVRPATARLRAEAERAMQQPPLTVTAKLVLPPSGSPNDYQSLGPYWWPDPSRPDGVPYIRRDGQTNPESLDPRHSDRAALRTLIDTVDSLAWAYHYLGDERYAAHAARLLRVFFLDPQTRMNPHLRYAQAIRGVNDGRFIGIIDTSQLPRVLDAATLLRPSDAWTDADHAALGQWVGAFLDWLTTHPFGAQEAAHPNNHGTWYDVQVASYAAFLGREDLLRQAVERSRDRIAAHIRPDGAQPHELARTRSFSYSVMNLRGLMLMARLGERVGIDLWNHEHQRLRVAVDFLARYADPTVEWPYPQITEADRGSLALLLRLAAAAYDEPHYERALHGLRHRIADHRLHLTEPPGAAAVRSGSSSSDH
jgi:hypothetical protein